MTTQEQLNQINAAIAAIETGAQEYRIGSRLIKRPDISMLYQERRRLNAQLNEESSIPYDIVVAAFDRR